VGKGGQKKTKKKNKKKNQKNKKGLGGKWRNKKRKGEERGNVQVEEEEGVKSENVVKSDKEGKSDNEGKSDKEGKSDNEGKKEEGKKEEGREEEEVEVKVDGVGDGPGRSAGEQMPMRVPRELRTLLGGPSMTPEGPRARTVTEEGRTVTPKAGDAAEGKGGHGE